MSRINESFVPSPFQNQGAYLFCNFPNGSDGRAVQVVVILAGFDEQVILNVRLHLFPGGDKVIVPVIHLVISFRSSGVLK